MARPANSYRAARRAAGKAEHRKNGAGVSANMPRVSISPVANRFRKSLPVKKPYNLQAGNYPGSVRRFNATLTSVFAAMFDEVVDEVLDKDMEPV